MEEFVPNDYHKDKQVLALCIWEDFLESIQLAVYLTSVSIDFIIACK